MRPDGETWRSGTLLALLLLGAAELRAYTLGQEAYVQGEQAWLADDFDTAAAKMREAIREDPAEAPRKFRYKGLNLEDYYPHLYLGLALERLGQREAAAAALGESRRQGAVTGNRSLSRLLSAALQRLVPPTPEPRAPSPVPTGRPPVPSATPVPLPTPASPPAPAPTPWSVPRPTEGPVRPSLPSAPGKVERRPREPGGPASILPAVAPSPGTVVDAGQREAVRKGIRLYFAGDYAGAIRALEGVKELVPAGRLFTAYALAGQAVLASPRDEALLKRAAAEFAEARAGGAVPLPADLLSRPVREVLGLP